MKTLLIAATTLFACAIIGIGIGALRQVPAGAHTSREDSYVIIDDEPVPLGAPDLTQVADSVSESFTSPRIHIDAEIEVQYYNPSENPFYLYIETDSEKKVYPLVADNSVMIVPVPYGENLRVKIYEMLDGNNAHMVVSEEFGLN